MDSIMVENIFVAFISILGFTIALLIASNDKKKRTLGWISLTIYPFVIIALCLLTCPQLLSEI